MVDLIAVLAHKAGFEFEDLAIKGNFAFQRMQRRVYLATQKPVIDFENHLILFRFGNHGPYSEEINDAADDVRMDVNKSKGELKEWAFKEEYEPRFANLRMMIFRGTELFASGERCADEKRFLDVASTLHFLRTKFDDKYADESQLVKTCAGRIAGADERRINASLSLLKEYGFLN